VETSPHQPAPAKARVQAIASLRTPVTRPAPTVEPRSLSDAPIIKLVFRRSHRRDTGAGRAPLLLTRGPPPGNGRAPAGNGAAVSAELTRYLTEDHDRIAESLNDVVVRRIFAAGLDLHAALGLIGEHRGAGKIYHAIDELDNAIRDIRDAVFAARTIDDVSVTTANQGSPYTPPLVRAGPGGFRKPIKALSPGMRSRGPAA
jgi:hypothetical protein